MLWHFGARRKDISLDLKSPQFWAGAILLSLSTALLYPIIMGRNYLKGYSFKDVCYVWFGSAGVALIAWAGTVLVMKAVRVHKECKTRLRTFSSEDTPVDVLRKLSLNGLGFKLKQAETKFAGAQVRAFVLQNASADGANWVAPLIKLSPKVSLSPEVENELNARLAEHNAPGPLIDFIQRNGISAEWADSALGGVVKVSEFTNSDLPAASLVELG
jgi:hypothetical protein